MRTKDFTENIEKIDRYLIEYKDRSEKYGNLSIDWNKIIVEPLLCHIKLLLMIIRQFHNSLNDEIIRSGIDYFDYNINGLKRQFGRGRK